MHINGNSGLSTHQRKRWFTYTLMETVVYLHTKRNGGLTICTLAETVVYLHTKGNGGLSTCILTETVVFLHSGLPAHERKRLFIYMHINGDGGLSTH